MNVIQGKLMKLKGIQVIPRQFMLLQGQFKVLTHILGELFR